MIVIAGTIPIKPERREEAKQLALQMAAATHAEAGCLTYQFYADLADPNTFFIFEEWESEEALQRHFQLESKVSMLNSWNLEVVPSFGS